MAMHMMPMDFPPEGTPEWEKLSHDNKGPSITITCWLFSALATVFVGGRLFVRWRMYRRFQDDDFWCVLATICAVVSTALCQIAVDNGSGRHMPFLTKEQQEKAIFWVVVGISPGVLSLAIPKLAVVSLLTKLLNPHKYHRWFLWFLAVTCILVMCGITGTLLGQCQPMRSQWDFDVKGTCVDRDPIVGYSIFGSVFSASVDFYLAIYPAVVLFNLQMKMQKKLILVLALGIGMVSGAMAIYKATKLTRGLSSPDFSYESSDLVIWTIAEAATIIIAATIPVLGPLLEYFPKRRLSPFRRDLLRRLRNKGADAAGGCHEKRASGDGCGKGRRSGLTEMDLEETIVGDNNSQDGIIPKGSQDNGSHRDDCDRAVTGRTDDHDCTGTRTEVRYSANLSPSARVDANLPVPPVPQPNHIMRTSEVHVSYTSAPLEVAWPPRAH